MGKEQTYDGYYKNVAIGDVFREMRALHITTVILILLSSALVIGMSGLSLYAFTAPLVIACAWALSMFLVAIRHRRVYVLTEMGLAQKAEAEEQVREQQAQLERESAEFFDRWYIRYPLGTALFGLAVWFVSLGNDWKHIAAAGVVGIYAAVLTREIALVVLAIAGIYWAMGAVSGLSIPAAIIIGAIIIALAVKK